MSNRQDSHNGTAIGVLVGILGAVIIAAFMLMLITSGRFGSQARTASTDQPAAIAAVTPTPITRQRYGRPSSQTNHEPYSGPPIWVLLLILGFIGIVTLVIWNIPSSHAPTITP